VGRKPLDELSKEGKKLLRELILHQDHPLPAKIYPIKKPTIKASTTFDMSEEFKRMDDAIASFADELNILEEEEERPKSQVDVSQEEAEYDEEMDALMKEIFGETLSGDGLHPFKKRADPKSDAEQIGGNSNFSNYAMAGGALSINHIKKMLKASYNGQSIGIGGKGENPPAPERIDDFILDKQLSGQYGVVYFNPRTGQSVVVHRGTKEAMDWTNNAMYALGMYKYTNRYKTGLQMQRKAEKKYGAKNITTLGHSQSAELARQLGQNTKEIITLNPAYKGEKPLKNEYNIRSSGDVVSAGLWGTKRGHDLIIPAKTFNPLTEHMIDILDRVDQNKMFGAN
jgi:hypothetical protein